MAYNQGTRLGAETASKLGHLSVIQSEWVRSLIESFEDRKSIDAASTTTTWQRFNLSEAIPLRNIWAVDGSFVTVSTDTKPVKEVAFVKTALLSVDKTKLDSIDKEHPHPLLLQDILRESAVFHSTVFPLRNIQTSLGSNYDAVRNIVNESIKIDEDGVFYETLKWITYQKWEEGSKMSSPEFDCPHCYLRVEGGFEYNSDEGKCGSCGNRIFLTDMIGFHLDMDEDSAPDSVASAYMLLMEHLMLFTAIRLLWGHSDKSLVSETIFIKDGPLTLRSQYSKLVPNIRVFFEFAKAQNRIIHVIGQEKSGAFFDHLSSIVLFTEPFERGDDLAYAPLSHGYVRKEVYRSPELSNPYGSRTNWGEKLYVKLDSGTYMVLNVPTGLYKDDSNFPSANDMIGLRRILATIPGLVSHKYEGALFPIELANGISSMSSYPSAKILQRFISSS